mgnify:CR=1 FL=1|tara:strand:+ start:84498 stop:85829 length:1332 start_codon:yes stop_codon:yes gene_type:complete
MLSGMLNKWFKLDAHGTTLSREFIAGLTTFAAMAYILAVNPEILSQAGMDRSGLITVTALAAALGCFLMAGFANMPIALAPGMGTNSYFAFIICLGMGATWQQALAMVFWNGILFLILSVTGARSKVIDGIPNAIKIGVQCGLGLFIAFIGLQKTHLVVGNPHTLLAVGDVTSASAVMALGGLALMVLLTLRGISGAIIISILLLTAVGSCVTFGGSFITVLPKSYVSLPAPIDQTFFALDIWYPITHFKEAYATVFTLFILDLFDSIGTIVGLSQRAGLADKQGRIPKLGAALTADATATITGALLGTSTTTAYIESATGVESGGRTGLTSVFVGLFFLVALFFTPLISVIPSQATAPALMMVGIFMMQGVRQLNFDDLAETAPAFLTLLMIPLTFSITQGISLGLLFYIVLALLSGRKGWEKLSGTTLFLGALFVLHYILL